MIISDYQIYRYSLPYVRPIKMLNHKLTTRDGLLVKLVSEDGSHAWGDVPPFPGLSDESIELAYLQLDDVCRSLKGRENPVSAGSPVRGSALFPGLYPSVAFGIEAALIDLAAQAANTSMATFFSPQPHHHIRTNALLTGSIDELTERAKFLVNAGYTHLKIKVGRSDVDEEINMLKTSSAQLAKNIILRLDANRAWSLDEALHFARGLSDLNIEYIEEPLSEPIQLDDFYRHTHMPIALDESLPDFYESPPSGTAAFIIKPGIHGGVFECIRLIRAAKATNIKPVLSSAFLSAVGLRTSVFMASAFTTSSDVMGLDTSVWLEKDFLSAPLDNRGGAIDVFELDRLVSISSADLKLLGA